MRTRWKSNSLNRSRSSISLATVFVVFISSLAQMQFAREASASGTSVTAPSQPTFSLNTSNQDPGDFVISGFSSSATLLVSIGFVNPPAGTSFALPSTTGLTASSGYDFTGGKTQISFTGTQNNANAALAAMTVSTGSTSGDITIRVTASLSIATVFYNPINNHYYEYFSDNVYAWNTSPDTSTSAIHLAETKTRYGVSGYLATITNAQEQKFIYENFSYSDIWIGATDDYAVLNARCGGTAGWSNFANQSASEGKWYWISGPAGEKCKEFWRGATTSGLWINSETNATLTRNAENVSSARYENWCTGNSSPSFTLTSGRSMGEPNDAGAGGEQFALEKWNGATCWNDWGRQSSGQKAYLVEYSGDFSDPATFATATLTARVSNAPRNVSAARANPALSGELNVTWQAPLGVTPSSYTVTSSPGGRTCTSSSLACTVTGLTDGTSYTFTVVANFSDGSSATSLASAAVSPAATPVTITYDSQGGSSIASGTNIVGGSVSSSPGTPTRNYFSFNGWFTASSGGSAVTFPHVHGRTSDFTLFAQWTDTRRPQTISLSDGTLYSGGSIRLVATDYLGLGSISFYLQGGDCTLTGDVLVANSGNGGCFVSASIAGDGTYQPASTNATFTLRNRQNQTISFTSLSNMIVNSNPQAISAISSSGLTVSVASNTQSICTVISGSVRPLNRGTCTLVASQGGNSAFSPAQSVLQSFNVTGLSQTIDFPQPVGMTTVGDEQKLLATSSAKLPITYRSTTPVICSINGDFLVPLSAGQCTVIASQVGDGTFEPGVDVTRTLLIVFQAKSPQAITVSPLSAMILGDVSQKLSLSTITGTAVEIFSVPSEVCTVDSQRQIIAKAEGQCRITLSQSETRQFLATETRVSITVYRNRLAAERAVAIDWPRPTSIDEKTPLGVNQLNARASVAGSFSYLPAAGTVLPGGIHDLTVIFTPTDRANFIPMSSSVRILITRLTSPSPQSPRPAPSPSQSPILVKPVEAPTPLTVTFSSGSSALSSDSKSALREYAKLLKDSKVARVEISGFTDNAGRDNLRLSKARAVSVKRFLIRLIPDIKGTVGYFGASKPIASNATPSGRALNRRAIVTPLP